MATRLAAGAPAACAAIVRNASGVTLGSRAVVPAQQVRFELCQHGSEDEEEQQHRARRYIRIAACIAVMPDEAALKHVECNVHVAHPRSGSRRTSHGTSVTEFQAADLQDMNHTGHMLLSSQDRTFID